MDFTFTDDQLALRDSVSRFLMNEAAPELLREIWETGGGRSPELRSKIAEQGMTGLSVPEAYGGLGMGDLDWALITEELGYYAIPDSLADTACVATGLLRAMPDAEPLRAEWLPKIADGSVRVAIAHPVNPWVADAHLADLLLAFRAADDGVLELHAVHGVDLRRSALDSIDASRRLAVLSSAA